MRTPKAIELLGTLLFYSCLYSILRSLTATLGLAYYDDSETLYHAFSILQGKVPYLEDHSHHFLGYVLPFVIGAKLVGFSEALIRQVAFINQVATAFGVFLILRHYESRAAAVLGGALLLSAHEPWVLGFHQQFEINLCTVYIILTALQAIETGKRAWLGGSFFLSGLAFTFDQRAAFLAFIPLVVFALLLPAPEYFRKIYLVLMGAVCPAIALGYLTINGALQSWFEQTLIYPSFYRAGSKNLLEVLLQGIEVHKYLVTQTPIFLALALIGGFIWVREWKTDRSQAAALILASILPLLAMPLFGARDFDYYTITWFPLMAIFAAHAPRIFKRLNSRVAWLVPVIVWTPVGLSVLQVVMHANWEYRDKYDGDAITDTVAYLKRELSPTDSVYVWGYRLDTYIYLRRLSPLPFVNTIMVDPDDKVTGEESRQQHVYPKYEQEFMADFMSVLPKFVVVFDSEDRIRGYSMADNFVRQILAGRYELVFKSRKRDFRDKETSFDVFRRRA